jgi:hypothetical protein
MPWGEGEIMTNQSRQLSADDRDVNRRALLRRGGVIVAATVAGAAAVEAMNAGDAQAAPGDAVIQGQSNNAGAAQTTLTSNAATSTLALANTGTHAPVTLALQTLSTFTAVAGGELENLDGALYSTVDFGGTIGPVAGFVYTEFTANQVVTIKPQRILDTRNSAGRVHILNKAGNLDSAGRLLAGHTINIDLSGLEFGAASAFCNLIAVQPLAGGFMTLFPGGTRPATSSLNFAQGAVIGNFAVTGTSNTDTVSIFSSATSHVALDMTAFNVGSPGQINSAILPTSASGATSRQLAARAKAGTLPDWYSGSVSR